MKNIEKILGFIGAGVSLLGLYLAFVGHVPWYAYFIVGATFFLAYLNHRRGNRTLFWLFRKDRAKLIKIYLLYTLIVILIEIVGRFYLNLWHYNFNSLWWEVLNVFLITYQPLFFATYEFLVLIKNKIRNKFSTFLLATLLMTFATEIPNTFAWEWTYTIPYVTYEILNINIVVIVGWSILISVPLIVKKLV